MTGTWLPLALAYAWMAGFTTDIMAEVMKQRDFGAGARFLIPAVAGMLWPVVLTVGIVARW